MDFRSRDFWFDAWRSGAPSFTLAFAVPVVVWLGILVVKAGLDVLGLVLLVGMLLAVIGGLIKAAHEFFLASATAERLIYPIWPLLDFITPRRDLGTEPFSSRALRAATPPPRLTPAI